MYLCLSTKDIEVWLAGELTETVLTEKIAKERKFTFNV